MGIDGTGSGNTAPYINSYTRQCSLNPYREVVSLNFAPWLADTMQDVSTFIGQLLVKTFGVCIAILVGGLFRSQAVFTS